VAPYTTEVSPVSAVLAGDVSASWACLARVFGWNLDYGDAELGGLVGECVAKETVGYAIHFPSRFAAELSLVLPELVETLDSDCSIVQLGKLSELLCEKPSVCADMVSLSPAEVSEFESCFASMPVLVSVFLQFGSAVLVSDLPQRDVASKVDLPQNPAILLVHHGDSNAIGVLVYADHIVNRPWRWRGLLEQHEETVATGHQDACGKPAITDVLQETPVGSIPPDWQAETLTVATDAENRMSASCSAPGEEAPVEAYRRPLNPAGDAASLPSVPLRFFDQLASYLPTSTAKVDCVVQRRVRPWLRRLYNSYKKSRIVLVHTSYAVSSR